MATTTVSHGSITFARIKDGAQFWTSTADPATPDYTFTISNLVGDTNADIKVGDIVYHSHYRYTVTNVNSDGRTVLCGNRESLKGDEGISPTIKSIVCSHSAVVCEKDGTYNPDTITFSGQSQFKEFISSYEGWFVIELSSDGVNWVSAYSSATKESSVDYKIPLGVNITGNGILYHNGSEVTVNGSIIDSAFVISSDGIITTTQDVGFIIRSIRCSLYSDNNKANLVDQQRINIAFDGVDGDKGDDGYTVVLTNENHTFSGNERSAVDSDQYTGFNVAECNVIAYFGDTQIPCTIGSITGMPTGMPEPTISNNSTNAAKFTVLVTSAMTSQNGTLNIPVTINSGMTNSKTFNMKFTYSLKLNGIDSTGLGWKVNYSSLTTQNDGECFYHGFDEVTKEPSSDSFTEAWVMWNGQEVIIPTGCYVNPGTTMPYNTTIYSVYRLPNATTYVGGTFHDVAWVESNNAWVSNTYNGTTPVVDDNPWSWDGATDIILATYKISGDENPITDAQLFIPPKKYSELVEPAKGMAIEAEKVATNYLAVDNAGIMVADMRDGEQTPSGILSGNNVFIDSTSVNIREGQNILASFGVDGMQIGLNNETRTEQDYHSWKMVDKDDNVYAFVSDLRDENGEATVTETAKLDGSTSWFETNFEISSIISIAVNGEVPDTYEIVPPKQIEIQPIPPEDSVVVVTYTSQSSQLKAYTFGKRATNSNIGGYSFAEGTSNTSSGYASHAEGSGSVASGYLSHAEGGNTTASGYASHAQNFNTTASSAYQTTIGKYNVDDANNQYAFIIGNGGLNHIIHKTDYSNALAIGWNGDMQVGGRMFGTLVEKPEHELPTRTPIPLFKTVSWSGNDSDNWNNVTIAKNSVWSRVGFNIYQKGYRALGVVGFGVYPALTNPANADWCIITKCYTWYDSNIITEDNHVGADTLDIYVWNQHQSESAKVRIFVRVLYIAESAFLGVSEPGT